MYILGDIGNTETKLCVVSKNNKILKKITFLSKSVNTNQLNILFKKNKIQLNKIEKILFGSVVPKTFSIIKKFLITGIGINIKKNPIIRNYPATNLHEVTKKNISKLSVENKLKQLFEKNLSKLYKIK